MDTSLFPKSFQTRLLSVISDSHSLDEATDGLLIHSDNFQALNLLQARYREQVKCIYIDPPYNTGNDGFIYKDGYGHSSWLTLMESRLQVAYPLLRQDGVNFISIDDNEQANLKKICDGIYGEGNFLAGVIWTNKEGGGSSDSKHFRRKHEYILCHAKNHDEAVINGVAIENIDRYTLSDKHEKVRGKYYLQKLGMGSIQYSETLDYEIETPDGGFITPSENNNGKKACWRWSKQKLKWGIENDFVEIKKNPDGIWTVYTKQYLNCDNAGNAISRTIQPFAVIDKFSTTQSNKKLKELFKEVFFNYSKPTELIKLLLLISINQNSTIVDYFAGSGTTAHAVINLNREDGGKRKYILIEQGEYFDTVLKPRVQKVIFSENWKDGKPQADKEKGYNGVSQIVKVLKLESYEDTLNNLQLQNPSQYLWARLPEKAQEDYLLHYMLDVESKGSLLNTDDFKKPFDYCLNIATDSAGAYEAVTIDLVETFNYLLGLRVERFNDAREKRGYLSVEGKLPSGENCLVLWRDCEQVGYEKLEEILASLNIEPNTTQYDVVYINGDQNIATVSQEDEHVKVLKLRPIESEFLRLMFEE